MEINNKDFDSKIIGKIKEAFEVKREETHHIVYKIYYNGNQIARTYRSHGDNEMSDKAIFGVRRQLHLSLQELKDLKNCPLTADSYKNLLKQRGIIKE